jgi:hypothetical protein
VAIDGHVSGNGSIHHREFEMASGGLTEREFVEFLSASFGLLTQNSKPGSVHFACMDWRHAGEILAAGKRTYDALLNVCVWAKDNGGMGSFCRSQHELVFVFRNGKASHRNNVPARQVWAQSHERVAIPGGKHVVAPGRGGQSPCTARLTVKPVALVADALLDCTAPRGIDTEAGTALRSFAIATTDPNEVVQPLLIACR